MARLSFGQAAALPTCRQGKRPVSGVAGNCPGPVCVESGAACDPRGAQGAALARAGVGRSPRRRGVAAAVMGSATVRRHATVIVAAAAAVIGAAAVFGSIGTTVIATVASVGVARSAGIGGRGDRDQGKRRGQKPEASPDCGAVLHDGCPSAFRQGHCRYGATTAACPNYSAPLRKIIAPVELSDPSRNRCRRLALFLCWCRMHRGTD